MKNSKLLIFTFFFLFSCTGVLSVSDANSNTFMLDTRLEAGETELELSKVTKELEALRYTLVRAKNKSMTTTLHSQILLTSRWDEYSPADKVRTLRHELVHAKQWRTFGIAGFPAKYAIETQRWVLEMHGYRQNIRDMCDMGKSREKVLERIGKVSGSFVEGYKMRSTDPERVRVQTERVLMEELERWEGCK